jgi:hypothetical protein
MLPFLMSGIGSAALEMGGKYLGTKLDDMLGIGGSSSSKNSQDAINNMVNQGNSLWDSAFFNAAGDTGSRNVHETFANKMGGGREYGANINAYNQQASNANQLMGNANRNAANVLGMANRDVGNQQNQIANVMRNNGNNPAAIAGMLGQQNMGDMYAKILGQAGQQYSNDVGASSQLMNQAMQNRNQGRDIFRTTEIDPYKAQIDQSKVSSILNPAASVGNTASSVSADKKGSTIGGALIGTTSSMTGDAGGSWMDRILRPKNQQVV